MNGTGTSAEATRTGGTSRLSPNRSAIPAAISALTPLVFGPSSTRTTRPVLRTDAPIVP